MILNIFNENIPLFGSVVVVGLMLIPLANHLFSKWRMDESVQIVNQPTNTNDVGVQTVGQSKNTA